MKHTTIKNLNIEIDVELVEGVEVLGSGEKIPQRKITGITVAMPGDTEIILQENGEWLPNHAAEMANYLIEMTERIIYATEADDDPNIEWGDSYD